MIVGIVMIFLIIFILIKYTIKETKAENENLRVHRSNSLVNQLGGVENVDIDLSKYNDKAQLVVLKDKKVCIGRNNFSESKIIDFESIINIEIDIENIEEKVEDKYIGYRDKRYSQEIVKSVTVYIHTTTFTEELVFSCMNFRSFDAQWDYTEIIKGVKRFKAILDNEINKNDTKSKVIDEENNALNQIKNLKELLDLNAITQQEFENKKLELLNKI